jgi:DNA mismatch endonuclease (patch repair protein)
MTDIFVPCKRSELMSRVRSRDTEPELSVRRLLHACGYRFRLHQTNLPGKPDIVLPRYRTAVFVHGCFWHGHQYCGAAKRPQTNTDFWNAKLDGNIARDKRNIQRLRACKWRVVVLWECEIPKATLPRKLARALNDLDARRRLATA